MSGNGGFLLVNALRTIFSSAARTRTRMAMTTTTGLSSSNSSKPSSKILFIIRHGQATHNPRAEAARSNGCSTEEFFDLMRQDDEFDANLTDLGRRQAKRCQDDHFSPVHNNNNNNSDNDNDNNRIDNNDNNPRGIDLVVGSSLSRTMDTADIIFPDNNRKEIIPRISIEYFREVTGKFLNGKRRNKKELISKFPHWNFDSLTTEEDESWMPEVEKYANCAERGYLGLVMLLTRQNNNNNNNNNRDNDNENESRSTSTEQNILLVCHGGILRYVMTIHPLVHLRDERRKNGDHQSVESRFDNCELRKYRLSWKEDDDCDRQDTTRRAIVLTQLDH